MVKTINICRCCLQIGCYRDLSTEYFWGGKPEVYEQMLLNTFNLQISYQEGGGPCSSSRLICDECIGKLREATEFKNQVLRNEQEIQTFLPELLDENKIETYAELENEEHTNKQSETDIINVTNDYNADDDKEKTLFSFIKDDESSFFQIESDDDNIFQTDVIEDVDDKTDILLNEPLKPSDQTETTLPDLIENKAAEPRKLRPRKRKAGDTNIEQLSSSDELDNMLLSDVKKNKILEPKREKPRIGNGKKGRTNTKKIKLSDPVLLSRLKGIKIVAAKTKKTRIKKKKTDDTKSDEIDTVSLTDLKYKDPYRTNKRKKTTDEGKEKIRKMQINTVNLLWLSKGPMLFQTRQNLYQCFMCKKDCINLKQLRVHMEDHSQVTIIDRINHIKSYKHVEISDLSCRMCDINLNDIEELSEHLKTNHDIPITDDGHFLVPYKTENGLYCFFCKQQFDRLCILRKHMSAHYSSHICEECGDSFLTNVELYNHKRTYHILYNCVDCGNKFATLSLLRVHKKQAHDKVNPRKFYCIECAASFEYHYQIRLHRIEKHGWEKPPLMECESCHLKCSDKISLNRHMRAVHLKEKNFSCNQCPKRFFTKYDWKRHLLTHNPEWNFQCDLCIAKFKGKDCLRRHIKKVHGKKLKQENPADQ